jgi:Lar family restriction alleviation protein
MTFPKLKPCPFCGGKAALVGYSCNAGEGYRGTCLTCEAEGSPVIGGNVSRDLKPEHKQLAIARWNARAEREKAGKP